MAMRSRSRTNDPEGVRRRLIDAAYRAFTRNGYGSTAIHDLKRETGISGGAFSHHFPTKKSLGLAVIRDRVRPVVEETWIEPVRRAETAAHGIAAVFNDLIADLDGRRRIAGCPLNNLVIELSGTDRDMRIALDAIFRSWRTTIAEKVRDDNAAGRTRVADPDAAAMFVVAAYSGAMAMAKSAQSTEPLRICAEQIKLHLASDRS
jgi:AcrR family transcriptional regulator